MPHLNPTIDPAGPVGLSRLPQTDDELWWAVKFTWDIEIPRVKVCPEHSTPFAAFAEAYFAREPVSIWKASRGYGGKSFLVAVLSLTEAAYLGAESSVLGGSAAQSLNVHSHTHDLWGAPNAPRHLLADAPTRMETYLTNGGHIKALMASQRSVRGPHPQRLRLDEIDEMELEILEAAQGQPMPSRGIQTQTVMSSTHQYPDATMSAMLVRAHEKGWPVHEWCYRETMGTRSDPGWLHPTTVLRKKKEVAERFWLVEYDLQAPSFEGRAIDSEKVDEAFYPPSMRDDAGTEVVHEQPVDGRRYITGVDWAKETDWTVVRTFDATEEEWKEVAFLRVQRRPWPEMVALASSRMERYPGIMVHDATGLGNVIDDYLELPKRKNKVIGEVLAGRHREVIFNEYISAIEDGNVLSPRIEWLYFEHLYVRGEDLFKPGGHPPDSFVAGALAWSARNVKRRRSAAVRTVTKPRSQWRVPNL